MSFLRYWGMPFFFIEQEIIGMMRSREVVLPILSIMRDHMGSIEQCWFKMFNLCHLNGYSHSWPIWSASWQYWQCKKNQMALEIGCFRHPNGTQSHSWSSWMFVLPNMTMTGCDWSPVTGVSKNGGATPMNHHPFNFSLINHPATWYPY